MSVWRCNHFCERLVLVLLSVQKGKKLGEREELYEALVGQYPENNEPKKVRT
jgi:hypothetical protein